MKGTYIQLEGLDEVVDERVTHLVDLIEESVHHVVLDLQLGELRAIVVFFISLWLRYESRDAVVEDFCDSLWLSLLLSTRSHSGEAILLATKVDVSHVSG